jgi:hypothetical protein
LVVQFAFKEDFNSDYQAVGSEKGSFDSKSSGCKAKPPQWHARFCVQRKQQMEERRPSAILSSVLQRRYVLHACKRKEK